MDTIQYIIVVVLVVAGIFFLLREVVTWYFKQNEIVNLLGEISRKLDLLVKEEEIPPLIDRESVPYVEPVEPEDEDS